MKYTFLIVFGLGLMLSSCDKFLKETPTDRLTTDASITSVPGGIALANGCYRQLTNYSSGSGGQVFTGVAFEMPTGKAFIDNLTAGHGPYLTNTVDGTEQYSAWWWNTCYAGIRDCNLAISMIPKVTGLSDALKSQYIGEARTLRAWYYFTLVRYYGDCPMNNKVYTNVNEAYLPRTSLKTIYDKMIIPDLEYAVNTSTLVDAQSSDGRVTKYTSRMILADVYLTCAGYPYQEVADTVTPYCTEGLWSATTYPVNTPSAISFLQKSKAQLDVLYGMTNLSQWTYGDLHDPAHNNKGEMIFQGQYSKSVNNNFATWMILPQVSHCSTRTLTWAAMNVQNGYYKSYSNADLRKQERQYFFTSDTWQKDRDPSEPPDPVFNIGYPFMFKFYDKVAIKVDGLSDVNWTFYRYADVLLFLTEVNWTLKQLGQSVPDADILKGINEVRRRALLPEYLITDVTFLTIMSERAYELLFESKMLWDMRRTRKAITNGSGSFASVENLVGHFPDRTWMPDNSYNHAIDKHELLQPIPKYDIDNNRKSLQNYGYIPKQIGQN